MIKLLKYIPLQFTFFVIAGILIGDYYQLQPLPILWSVGIATPIYLIGFVLSNKYIGASFFFSILFFTMAFLIGLGSVSFQNELYNQHHFSNQREFSNEKESLIKFRVEKELKATAYQDRYEVEIRSYNDVDCLGKALLYVQKDSAVGSLSIDDVYRVESLFRTVKKPMSPYGFNYKKYLKNQGIHFELNVKYRELYMGNSSANSLKGYAASLRKRVNVALRKHGFKDDELATINALLLGQRSSISKQLLENYIDAGAIHILAVSGLHVGILLLILNFLCRPLHGFKYGKFIAAVLVITSLWGFAFIAGLSASVVRAVTMFTALSIGLFLNKPSSVYHNLIISMLILLLVHPLYLFEVGFQLSYLAVFSIVWIQPKIYALWKPDYWLVNKGWQLLTVSIAAQLGVLPLSLFYFHQFPGLFFVSNMVIIPLLGTIIIGGILVIILALIGIVPEVLGSAYINVISKMNWFVSWVSAQDSFVFKNITFSWGMLISAYVFIFVLFNWNKKEVFKSIVLMLMAVILMQAVFIFEKKKRMQSNEFIVFNNSRASLNVVRRGNELTVLTSIDSISLENFNLKSLLIQTGVKKGFKTISGQHYFVLGKHRILIVDSLGLYNFKSVNPTIVLLQNSPKINMERLIIQMNPELIVADASNYKSYKKAWKETCSQKETPFHDTSQKGAFILKLE